jgi:hypothetical protein
MTTFDVALVGGGMLHRQGLRQSLDQGQFAIIGEQHEFSSMQAFTR